MRKSKWTAGALVAAMLLTLGAGLVAPVTADAASVKLKTKLTGAPIGGVTPKGQAKYRDKGTSRKFHAEVDHVNLPAGTVLTVFVKSTKLGTITLGSDSGSLELNTKDGQTVPTMAKGDVITVVDPSSITILSGTF